MVLKLKTIMGPWRYIDNIHDVEVVEVHIAKDGAVMFRDEVSGGDAEIEPNIEIWEQGKSKGIMVAFGLPPDDRLVRLVTSESAYLLNDQGGTIERLN